MNDTVALIILIMAGSTIFPMIGYYLDRRHRNKMMKGGETEKKD